MFTVCFEGERVIYTRYKQSFQTKNNISRMLSIPVAVSAQYARRKINGFGKSVDFLDLIIYLARNYILKYR